MFVPLLRRFVSFVDALSLKIGHAVKYLIPALILVLTIEVVSRYVFNSPTIWVLETSMMIFGSIGALCWGYTLRIGGHVRVDVFYSMFSKRLKAFVDVALTLLFMFPFELILIYTGVKWSLFALKTGEKMVESSWLPPTAPFRIVLTIGFILFFAQTVSEFIKNFYYLVKKEDLIMDAVQTVQKEGLL
jgi:TRAP-type mannitol/chloroaromatic compound transport system permease small subunit